MQTLLQGAKVYNGHGFDVTDILVRDGIIAAVAPNITAPDTTVYKFHNKYIFPGFVDVHVHFREPGFSYKEDIKTGSLAAAAGGYTDVCTMPNLSPVPDSAEHLKEETDAISEKAVINVYPYGSLSKGEEGKEISDLEAMAGSVIGFSDDGKGLASDDIMREAMLRSKALGKPIAAHCEDMSVIGGSCVHDGVVARHLGIRGISSESEWKMVERDIELARETGCAYHVCHVSTKESVELIKKAKAAGVNVTCETGPHYLLLDENDILGELEKLEAQGLTKEEAAAGLGRFKMNPPLRTREDREALVEGLKNGIIDMIATDHAPHAAEEKAKGILGGPMGVVGLENAFAVLYTGLVKTGVITLERLIELMCKAPAERFSIESTACDDNGISEGATAKLCVFDLEEEHTIEPASFASKGRYTPFDGQRVWGRCLMTVCGSVVNIPEM